MILADDFDFGVAGGDFLSRVRRAVVDDNDFVHRTCLRPHTFNRLADKRGGIKCRDDRADLHLDLRRKNFIAACSR